MNTVFFDLETQHSSDEVGGWGNIPDMGLSVAVTYNTADDRYHLYTEANVQALIEELQQTDLVVGFNINNFDYRVLTAYTDADLWQLPTLDMLEYLHARLGHRVSLDNLAAANFNRAKTADGLQAIAWWKAGDVLSIIEYCLEDVRLTRALYELGRTRGFLKYPSRGALRQVGVKW